MNANNWKKNISAFFTKFIKSDDYKHLRIIYLIAFIPSIAVFLFMGTQAFDTPTYYAAKDKILTGSFDAFRTPLYPVFLLITQKDTVSIIFQFLLFFISIAFLYKALENFKISRRLIFVAMLVYVCHPAFTYWHNYIMTEGLTISLSSILLYYLTKYIKNEKTLYCWILHILILLLILLRPGSVFLLAIPAMLLFYWFFTKRKRFLSCLLPFVFVLLSVTGYGFAMKQTYGVFGLSAVSDINLYWMLRDRDEINPDVIENSEIRTYVVGQINSNNEHYYNEAYAIFTNYGWKELHNVVQSSLKGNYKSILLGEHFKIVRHNMYDDVGAPHFFKALFDTLNLMSYLPSFNLFTLAYILLFYFILIVRQICRQRAVPVLSVLLLTGITANFGVFVLIAPINYGRLIIPSISAILIVCAQCVEWFMLFIQKKEKQFKLI